MIKPSLVHALRHLFLTHLGHQTVQECRETAIGEGLQGALAFVQQELFPEAEFTEGREQILSAFSQAAGYLGHLDTLGRAFQEADIEVIAIKGIALTCGIYSGAIGSRELSDIDLLVKPADLLSVRKTLEAQEFRTRIDTDMGYVNTGGYYLDLHTILLGPIDRAYHFDPGLAWENRELLREDLPAICTPERHYHLCYLAVHGMKHGFSRLKWLLDLALLVGECDGNSLLEMAKKTSSVETVSVALAANHLLFGVAPPVVFLEEVQKLGYIEKLFIERIANRTLPAEAGKILAVWGAKGVARKAAVIKELMFVNGQSVPNRGKRALGVLGKIFTKD